MELGWGPEADDLRDALRARREHRRFGIRIRQSRRNDRWLIVSTVVLLVLAAGVAIGLGDYVRGGVICGLVVLLLGHWVYTQRRQGPGHPDSVARIFDRSEASRLPISCSITPDGVRTTTSNGSFVHPWPEVRSAIETGRSIVLIVKPHGGVSTFARILVTMGALAAFPIPKRALAGEQQLAELRELIETGTGKKALAD